MDFAVGVASTAMVAWSVHVLLRTMISAVGVEVEPRKDYMHVAVACWLGYMTVISYHVLFTLPIHRRKISLSSLLGQAVVFLAGTALATASAFGTTCPQ